MLAGFDQKSNVVLSDCKERVYSTEEGVEEIPLGLYLVKGETVYAAPSLLRNVYWYSSFTVVSLAKLMKRLMPQWIYRRYAQSQFLPFDMVKSKTRIDIESTAPFFCDRRWQFPPSRHYRWGKSRWHRLLSEVSPERVSAGQHRKRQAYQA